MAQVVGDITGRQRAGAFGFRFHVMHTTRCGFDIVFFFNFAGLEQNRRDHEGDRHRCDNRGDVSEVGAFGVIASTAVIEPGKPGKPDRH